MAVHSFWVIVGAVGAHAGKVIGKGLAQKQCKRLFLLVNSLSIHSCLLDSCCWPGHYGLQSSREKARMRRWKVICSDEMSGVTSDLEIVAVRERAERLPLGIIG